MFDLIFIYKNPLKRAEVWTDNSYKGRLVAIARRLQVSKKIKGNRTYENAQVIARELGRPPTVNKINQDPTMASY